MNLQRPRGYEVFFCNPTGTGWCSADRHYDCVRTALQWEADLICFLDADQMVPLDTLIKLEGHIATGDWDIAGALVPARSWPKGRDTPFSSQGWRRVTGVQHNMVRDEMEPVLREHGPLVEAHVLGTGVLMLTSEVIQKLEEPWFRETFDQKTYSKYNSMDTEFVHRLTTEAEGRMCIDTTINVVHLGIFLIDDTYADRFPDYDGVQI